MYIRQRLSELHIREKVEHSYLNTYIIGISIYVYENMHILHHPYVKENRNTLRKKRWTYSFCEAVLPKPHWTITSEGLGVPEPIMLGRGELDDFGEEFFIKDPEGDILAMG